VRSVFAPNDERYVLQPLITQLQFIAPVLCSFGTATFSCGGDVAGLLFRDWYGARGFVESRVQGARVLI
jgi:hypothetical protein